MFQLNIYGDKKIILNKVIKIKQLIFYITKITFKHNNNKKKNSGWRFSTNVYEPNLSQTCIMRFSFYIDRFQWKKKGDV